MSILTGVRFLRAELGVELPIPDRTMCRFDHRNRECLAERCPFNGKK